MKGWIVVIAVLFVAATLAGCSWFQSKENAEKPAKTESAMTDSTSYPPPASQPDSYVEPKKPWGSETLENLQRP